LWNGDLTLTNLELNCTSINNELGALQFPFLLVSGHLKLLKFQIPLTKIASESITTTLNNLELIVKLKSHEQLTSSPKLDKNKLAGQKKAIEDESSSGYVANLINKIVNNVSIICNSISIKFIEDDIVLSMNIQHLSMYSADSEC
jgi:vacuolar protein sorting-associated protein 13B